MATAVVIEDNPVNVELAAWLLRKVGHLVVCAADAEAGVVLACADQAGTAFTTGDTGSTGTGFGFPRVPRGERI